MTDSKTDPGLMKIADEIFWAEFGQRDNPGDRYVVVDSKKQQVVVQNARLVKDMKKIRV